MVDVRALALVEERKLSDLLPGSDASARWEGPSFEMPASTDAVERWRATSNLQGIAVYRLERTRSEGTPGHDERHIVGYPVVGGSEAQEQLVQTAVLEQETRTSNAADHSLLHRALEMIRSEFQEKTWQAFWRVVVEEHYPIDVARDLEMSLGSVYQAKSRVLRRLKAELGELLG